MTTRRPAAWLGNPLFWMAAIGLLFALPIMRSVSRRLSAAPVVLGTLPAFSLTDQAGRPFGSRQLAGKVWVADFIFTSCQAACPMLTQRMAEVGRRTRHLGPDFHLVSITVDPTHDTPAALAGYGARFGANPASWSFLTGSPEAIEATVSDGFKVGMGIDKGEIFHSDKLVLVDRQLRVRGYFPATPEGLNQLMEAIGRVVNS